MQKQFEGNVGAAIGEQLEAKALKLNVAEKSLVGFAADNIRDDLISASALRSQRGIILISPGGKNIDEVLDRTEVHRWVLNPGRIKSDGHIVKPSIQPLYRVRFSCNLCGNTEARITQEDGTHRRIESTTQAYAATRQYTSELERNKQPVPRGVWVLCPRCERGLNKICKACGSSVQYDAPTKLYKCSGDKAKRCRATSRMWMTQLRPVLMAAYPRPDYDPVFEGENDPRFKGFVENWAPAKGLVLPRIWAVYPEGQAPADWQPDSQDMTAMSIAARLSSKEKPLSILPFALARKNKSNRPVQLILEARKSLQVGWVDTAELYHDKKLGWNRNFLRRPNSISSVYV